MRTTGKREEEGVGVCILLFSSSTRREELAWAATKASRSIISAYSVTVIRGGCVASARACSSFTFRMSCCVMESVTRQRIGQAGASVSGDFLLMLPIKYQERVGEVRGAEEEKSLAG